MAQPELFINDFHLWLEANGVRWHPGLVFTADIDLNALKIGVAELIGLDRAARLFEFTEIDTDPVDNTTLADKWTEHGEPLPGTPEEDE